MRARRGAAARPRADAARRLASGVTAAVLASACTLEEVTIVDPQDVIVAEGHVQVGAGRDGGNRVSVFLHRTLGPSGDSRPVPGARVFVSNRGGATVELAEATPELCVVNTPIDGTGSCHWAASPPADRFSPGDTVELRVELPGGGTLESLTVVPGAFALDGIADGGACTLPPDRSMEVRWGAAAGAWAYVNELLLVGLRDALALRGVEVDPEDDPLYLLGLSISAADTTIVFPGEFGVFNRFELDQEIALALQRGLPAGTSARVSISATDRNYVNWVRGGNFNPSGQVRIPSVRGGGTGVFSSAVVRSFQVVADPDGPAEERPACPGLQDEG